jgi:AraC family transcriptional regulator
LASARFGAASGLAGQPLLSGRSRIIEPVDWYASLPAPELESEIGGNLGVAVRSYRGTGAHMDMPALSENVVCLHQGGAKRLHRWQAGRYETWDVPADSVSLMPMFRANRWLTQGPVAFTHLTLSPGLLARFAREEFDREPNDLAVADQVGAADPLIANMLSALAEELRQPMAGRLYRESLVTAIILRVLRQHSSMQPAADPPAARGGLAGWQLRRVLDHMAARVDQDLGVADIVRLTGLSRGHFFRAFRQSTGQTPSRYLLSLRMERARQLLPETPGGIGEVARLIGFSGPEPFSRAFQRSVGMTPTMWIRRQGGRTGQRCIPAGAAPAAE